MKHRYWSAVVCLVACTALAKEAPPASNDPETDAHVMRLAEKLRCLVCQNQTIADSNAELAVDLRRQVREQIKAGKNDSQIMDYLVQRYGDFVLYQPPFKLTTLLLWVGPFVLLAGALALLFLLLARRRAAPAEAELRGEDRRLVERVLGAAGQPGGGGDDLRKGGAA